MSEVNNEEDVSGLKSKNTELIRKLKDAEARAKKAEDDAADAAENASSANATELEKAIKRAEKAERELKAADERATTSAKTLRDYRADNAIAQAIATANVDAKHVSLLSKALRADVEFSDDGEPLIGGKSVTDYTASFFAKDGLSYVRAANNSGGLAQGHDGSKAPRMTKDNFNYTEFGRIAAENPSEANAIADAIGRPELKSS